MTQKKRLFFYWLQDSRRSGFFRDKRREWKTGISSSAIIAIIILKVSKLFNYENRKSIQSCKPAIEQTNYHDLR